MSSRLRLDTPLRLTCLRRLRLDTRSPSKSRANKGRTIRSSGSRHLGRDVICRADVADLRTPRPTPTYAGARMIGGYMDRTTLLYVLSTVAQTLAALAAFVGS